MYLQLKNILEKIKQFKNDNKKQLAILIDPDKQELGKMDSLMQKVNKVNFSFIFVGGSLVSNNKIDEVISEIKQLTNIPVVIFPGNTNQISNSADGILLLSLISGRNPEYLIGSHVVAAPILKHSNLEIISTSYILIDSGTQTSVSYISNTTPIPRNKKDIAVATAIAGEMIGHKICYLEAGSGAKYEVPENTISAVKNNINIPIIVGGGINTIEKLNNAYKAGADLVVIGTAIEKNEDFLNELMKV
ncbi:MAG: geranylgeranylglyceryl/heptaprenylglyceryl phosphate synthase [Ichthyobacteriaceae bacterium]|nr:geranylgeranylglyceryl/heptaprenylglyceryl phosphate synthase [Ichthyobacteriaceae bacterium]